MALKDTLTKPIGECMVSTDSAKTLLLMPLKPSGEKKS
jgi:hypothetical protein